MRWSVWWQRHLFKLAATSAFLVIGVFALAHIILSILFSLKLYINALLRFRIIHLEVVCVLVSQPTFSIITIVWTSLICCLRLLTMYTIILWLILSPSWHYCLLVCALRPKCLWIGTVRWVIWWLRMFMSTTFQSFVSIWSSRSEFIWWSFHSHRLSIVWIKATCSTRKGHTVHIIVEFFLFLFFSRLLSWYILFLAVIKDVRFSLFFRGSIIARTNWGVFVSHYFLF